MAHRHVTCGPLGSALANESTKAGSQRVHRSIHKNNYTSRYSFSSIIMIILLAAAAAIYFSSLVVFLFHCRIFCCFSSPPPFHHVPLPIVVCSFCRPAMCVSDTRHYGVCLFFFSCRFENECEAVSLSQFSIVPTPHSPSYSSEKKMVSCALRCSLPFSAVFDACNFQFFISSLVQFAVLDCIISVRCGLTVFTHTHTLLAP